jgi:hypothetical protein
MKKYLVLFHAALLVIIGISSCTSTTLQSSWKAPGASYTKEQFKKVMVVALVKDETTRRIAEDKLASEDSAFRASYTVLGPDQQNMDDAAIKKFVAQHGFDGVVTMQLIDVQKNINYVPGTYQGGYYGWYGMNYNNFYTPGYYTEDASYIIETNIFSVAQDKLLWSGISSTVNPTSINKTIDEVWKAVVAKMKSDKFIVTTK